MTMLWLIARREFRTRTLSKANLISSGIMLVIIVGAALILKPIITGDDGEPDVVQVDETTTAALVPHLEAAAAEMDANLAFELTDAPDIPAATVEGADDEGLPDGIAGIITGPVESPEVFVDSADAPLVAIVHTATQAAVLNSLVTDLGGDPEAVAQTLATATPTVTTVGEGAGFDGATFVAGLALVLVLFFVLIQSSSVIMMGVVEEKSSRVVEILLATVRPTTLLGGKVLGVGLYSLVQAVVMVGPLVFAAWYLEFLGALEIGVGALLVNFGLWFILGFALFTVLFGGLAALVSRQEDIGSVSTPMMLLMMVPLYLAIYLIPNSPDGPVTTALTYVPFFAPFMVPMRTAYGSIGTAETVIAIAVCLIAIPVFTWIAGRVYAGAVLNTGGRMKMSDALRRG